MLLLGEGAGPLDDKAAVIAEDDLDNGLIIVAQVVDGVNLSPARSTDQPGARQHGGPGRGIPVGLCRVGQTVLNRHAAMKRRRFRSPVPDERVGVRWRPVPV